MLRRAALTLVALLLLSVVTLASISFSPLCIGETSKQYTNANEGFQEPKSRYQMVSSAIRCGVRTLGGAVIDHSNEISAAITAIATIFIALYTFALSDSTRALRDAAEQQKVDMQESLKIASRSADASRDTVNKMHEMAELELRAYVLLSGGKILEVIDPAKRVAQISLRNFGKTPAHEMRMWVGVHTREFPLRTLLTEPDAEIPMSTDVLAPGIPSVMNIAVSMLNPVEENELQAGRAAIYVWGRVTYADPFNPHRVTEFRLMCQGEALPEGRLSPAVDGNSYT